MTDTSLTSVTLGLVQHRCTPDPEENMRTAVRGVRESLYFAILLITKICQ